MVILKLLSCFFFVVVVAVHSSCTGIPFSCNFNFEDWR